MNGRSIAVVGPSGAGKDGLISGLTAADPRRVPVYRAIIRPADATERFRSMDGAKFARIAGVDDFALRRQANGLSCGIPGEVRAAVAAGGMRPADLSRRVLARAASLVPSRLIRSVTAPPVVLARSPADRGQETEANIAARLLRPQQLPAQGISVIGADNGGSLDQVVSAARVALSEAVP